MLEVQEKHWFLMVFVESLSKSEDGIVDKE